MRRFSKFVCLIICCMIWKIGSCDAIDFLPKFDPEFMGINFLRFDCDTSKCDPSPKHYEELGCKPIVEAGKCCPTSFDCQHLFTGARELNKCQFNGKSYNRGDMLDDLSTHESCEGSCFCDERKTIQCEHINCAEKFEARLDESCLRQYSLGQCCSTSTICGEAVEKLSACKFEGRVYREGEKMRSENSKCHICVCDKNFNATTRIDESEYCSKLSCLMEIHDIDNVLKRCAPIYHKDACCPHSWRCPSISDGIIPSGNSHHANKGNFTTPKCKFGNLELNVGDSLSSNEIYCSKCSCRIPPFVDCIFTSC